MADETENELAKLAKSYIYNSNDPNINQVLRQRIALAMMERKRAVPKNAGEGITAIGEALGENRLRNQLEAGDLAQQAVKPPPPDTAAPVATVAPPAARSLVPAEGDTDTGDVVLPRTPPPPTSLPLPPSEQTSAPNGLLSRENAGGIVGPYANNPAQTASLMNPQPTRVAPPTGGPLPTTSFQPQNQPLVPPQRQPPMPVSSGGYNILDQAANAPPPAPTAPAAPAVRDAVAGALQNQQNGPAVPQPNPMLAGQPASPRLNRDLVLSSDPAAGSPTGSMPANTMALRAPTDFGIKPAPPAAPPMQAAPPPTQVAQALGISPYGTPKGTPGYVVPKQDTLPEPPPPVLMSKREAQIRNWLAQNQNNPYAAGKVATELNDLVADRTQRQNTATELWKSKLTHSQQLDLKRQDQLRDQYKQSLQEIQEAQKIQAGQHTTVEGRLMMPDPNKPIGSAWIDVTAPKPGQKEGGPPVLSKPLTAEQDKSQKFLTQMILAEKQLEGKEHLLANSPGQDILNKFGGNALLDRNYRIARNAADFSVAANLRDISGATIGETEQVRQYKMAMPVRGDDAATIAAKRDLRKSIMDSMYNGLGEARSLVDYSKQEMIKRHDEDQARINETLNAKLGPQPKGYVAHNRKTGESRVFDGKNWLDYTP